MQNTSNPKINTHNLVVNFGRYNGERWTRIPLSYLRWLINEGTQYKDIAKAELERRGSSISPDKSVELSGHAIDKASLRLRRAWHQTAEKNEGLFSWLERVAIEAYKLLSDGQTKITYRKIKFIFMRGEIYPVLKTVMPTYAVKYREISNAGKKLLEAYYKGVYIQFAVNDEVSIYLLQCKSRDYYKVEQLIDIIKGDFPHKEIHSVAPLNYELRRVLEGKGIK